MCVLSRYKHSPPTPWALWRSYCSTPLKGAQPDVSNVCEQEGERVSDSGLQNEIFLEAIQPIPGTSRQLLLLCMTECVFA